MSRCAEWRHGRVAGVAAMIASDTRRYLNRSPEARSGGEDLKHLLSAFATPQLFALTIHRVAHFLECRGWVRLAAIGTRLNQMLHHVSISPRSCIGPACLLPHPAGVSFAGSAGRDLTLYALCVCSAALPCGDPMLEEAPRLGDGVAVGGHATLIGPVSVGDGCKIGYGVRVDRDVPAGMLVVSASMRVRFE